MGPLELRLWLVVIFVLNKASNWKTLSSCAFSRLQSRSQRSTASSSGFNEVVAARELRIIPSFPFMLCKITRNVSQHSVYCHFLLFFRFYFYFKVNTGQTGDQTPLAFSSPLEYFLKKQEWRGREKWYFIHAHLRQTTLPGFHGTVSEALMTEKTKKVK